MTDRWETLRSRLANDYQINLPMVKSDISAAERLIKTPDLSFRIMDGLGVSPMASQDEKLVPDLEDLPFDQLKADPQLPIKQIEQNFEEGLKYLRDCSILRSRYTEVAKDYVDTKLKIEEFWRLDEIHKLEEQNGVYEVALHDAEDEKRYSAGCSQGQHGNAHSYRGVDGSEQRGRIAFPVRTGGAR